MSASIPGTSLEKELALTAWLRAHAPVLIGYSGGVDSVYLAAVAAESLDSNELLAVIGRSASYPEEQWRVARDSAGRLGVRVLEASTDEMNDPRYAVLVMVDDPKGNKATFGYATGGWTAAPAVGRMVSRIASILGVEPVDDSAPTSVNQLVMSAAKR